MQAHCAKIKKYIKNVMHFLRKGVFWQVEINLWMPGEALQFYKSIFMEWSTDGGGEVPPCPKIINFDQQIGPFQTVINGPYPLKGPLVPTNI